MTATLTQPSVNRTPEGATAVVKFQDIGKDGEADLQLGRRLPNGVPVIDAFQHRMAD